MSFVPSNIAITDDNKVLVSRDCNIIGLYKLFSENPSWDIANYMLWRVVDHSMLYIYFWSKTLNLEIENFLKFLNFPIWTIPNIKFKKYEEFSIWEIPKIYNLANSKKIQYGNFQKFRILKIKTNFNFENFKNLQCDKFEKFAFSKILKISQIFQFQKTLNF